MEENYMKNKIFGVLTPILTIAIMFVIGIIVGLSYRSSDGWAALGAIIMIFMLTGLILVIMLVAALIGYFKKKSDYAQGILYGLGGLSFIALITALISSMM